MESDLNGQDKKVIAQYISDTLSKYELFQRDKSNQAKQFAMKILSLENDLSQERQKSELLNDELMETKERLNHLKRQQDIMGILKQETKQEPDSCSKMKINDISSISEIDEDKVKEADFERNRLRGKVEELENYCYRLKEQNEQCQKHTAILTDYINEKEAKSRETIEALEKEKEEWQMDYNGRQLKQDNEMIKTLQKEKKQLENKIQKCSKVVKELQEFYTAEIDSLKQHMAEMERKRKDISSEESMKQMAGLQESLKSALRSKVETDKTNALLAREVEEMKARFEEDILEILQKREQEKQEYEFSQGLLMKTYEKKFQILQEDFKRKVQEYEDKIRFLIIKVEESNHPITEVGKNLSCKWKFQQGMNLQDLSLSESQFVSYRVDESSRLDGTRLDPASVSRNIKQNLGKFGKRNQLPAQKQISEVTPAKAVYHPGVFSERINLL